MAKIYSVETNTSTITIVVRPDRTVAARAWVEGDRRPWREYERSHTACLLSLARRLPAYTIARQTA